MNTTKTTNRLLSNLFSKVNDNPEEYPNQSIKLDILKELGMESFSIPFSLS